MYDLSEMKSVVEAQLASQGKTLTQLADEVGVSTAQMIHWLDGTQAMELTAATTLADVLRISLDELAGRTHN